MDQNTSNFHLHAPAPFGSADRLHRARGTSPSGLRALSLVERGSYRIGVTGCACTLVATWAWLIWSAEHVLFDDAFISFRYAHNLVSGLGLVYNPYEYVEGYTNFAWVLIAALGLSLHLDPAVLLPIIGFLAYLGSIVLCASIPLLARATRTGTRSELLVLLLLPLLALPRNVVAFSGSGLETSFAGALVLLGGCINHLWRAERARQRLFAGLVFLVLALTRLDTLIAAVASGIVIALEERAAGNPWRALLKRLVATFGITISGLIAYIAWKLYYYGEILPNTYYAKQASVFAADAGFAYLRAFAQNSPEVLILLPLALIGGFSRTSSPRARFGLYAGLVLITEVAYIMKVGGDFMEYRFIWQYWPLFVALCMIGMLRLLEVSAPATVAITPLALLLATSPQVLETRFYMQSLEEMGSYGALAARIGPRLRAGLPRGTVVATTLAGLGYFAPDLVFIDQWGLNDAYVAHQPTAGGAGRGHVKFAPEDYLRTRNVNLYMAHPVICDCANPCIESKPNVFIRLDGGKDCVRTWYFTEREALTRHLCAHPEQFVLSNVTCPKS